MATSVGSLGSPASISHETAITNLLNIYAERMDAGDFDGVAALFERATLVVDSSTEPPTALSADQMLDLWRTTVITYDDGTPKTKHLVTNPIVTIDPGQRHASVRSYYTVIQAVPGKPFGPIVAGRYHDDFERDDDGWFFVRRDYGLVDLVGDASAHLRMEL